MRVSRLELGFGFATATVLAAVDAHGPATLTARTMARQAGLARLLPSQRRSDEAGDPQTFRWREIPARAPSQRDRV